MADPTPPAEPTPQSASAADSAAASQAEIDAMINAQSGAAPAATPAASAAATAAAPVATAAPVEAAAPTEAAAESSDADSLEELLKQANFEDPASSASTPPAADAEPFQLPSFQQVMQDAQVSSIDLLRDVELNVKIELGRNRMLVEDVLKLAEGSVVELDKLAGDPVDVFVNDRLVARGEVLVLNDNFCVRVNEIVAGAKEEGL
jgi:flagellar motor switch protein FliN/FliY